MDTTEANAASSSAPNRLGFAQPPHAQDHDKVWVVSTTPPKGNDHQRHGIYSPVALPSGNGTSAFPYQGIAGNGNHGSGHTTLGTHASRTNGHGLALGNSHSHMNMMSGAYGEDDDATLAAAIAAAATNAAMKRAQTRAALQNGNTVASSGDASKGKSHSTREYRNTRASGVSSLATLLWPIAACMILFVAVFLYKDSVLEISRHMRAEVLWSREAEFFIRQAVFRLRFGLSYCDTAFALDNLDKAEQVMTLEEPLVDEVLYGSTSESGAGTGGGQMLLDSGAQRNLRPGLQVSDVTRRLFLEYGCVSPSEESQEASDAVAPDDPLPYAQAECEAFYSGVLSKGLLAAFKSYTGLVRKLAASRRAYLQAVQDSNGTMVCQPADLSDPDVTNTYALGMTFLAPGFKEAADGRESEAFSTLNGFIAAVVAITVLAVFALSNFYVWVYRLHIQRLDAEIKNVRLLLLLFPDEVAKVVPAFLAASKDMMVYTSAAAFGVVAAMHSDAWSDP